MDSQIIGSLIQGCSLRGAALVRGLMSDEEWGFFAALTKRRLKRGVFAGIVDLQAAINRYVEDHNTDPKPFQWKVNPDKIIVAAARGHQTLDSIH